MEAFLPSRAHAEAPGGGRCSPLSGVVPDNPATQALFSCLSSRMKEAHCRLMLRRSASKAGKWPHGELDLCSAFLLVELCPPQIHMLKSEPPLPPNVTFFRYRVAADVMGYDDVIVE